MGKYRVLGAFLDRVFRNDLNANFNDVDADIQSQKKRVDDLIVANPQPAEVQDARGGFTVLRDRLDNTDVQLADTTKQFKFTKNEVTTRIINQIKPAVTFVSDDGLLGDYDTRLKSIFKNANAPCVLAIVTSRAGVLNTYMTWEQIKDLNDNYGYEIVSHTHNHSELDKLSLTDVEFELSESKRILTQKGYEANSLMIPYGLYNNSIKRIAQKYYRGVRTSDSGDLADNLNRVPIKNLQVSAYATEFDDLAAAKAKVDLAVANNAWLVFLFHGWETVKEGSSTARLQNLTDLIAYIKSKNTEIITFDEGLNRFGSVVDIGQNSEFRVGIDGTIKSSQINTVYLDRDAVNADTPISAFRRNVISICNVSNLPANTFPDSYTQAGLLLTYNFSTKEPLTVQNGYQYQEFIVYGQNRKYLRKVKTDGTWDKWFITEDINNRIVKVENLPSTHLPADLTPNCLNISTINQTGYPENKSGTLFAYAFGMWGTDTGYYFEEFRPYGTNQRYYRYWNGSAWSTWFDPINDAELGITTVVKPKDTYTCQTAPSGFTRKKITYTTVSANTAGAPTTSQGSLITNTIMVNISDWIFAYQEFHQEYSNNVWRRPATGSSTWGAWQKFNLT